MIDYNKKMSGIIENVFNEQELNHLSKYLQVQKTHNEEKKESFEFKPVGIGHNLYNWFNKKPFQKIISHFKNNQNIKMLFVSYTIAKKPFTVHSDYYHKRIGEPCVAILIPLSAGDNFEKINQCSTIIFNEQDTFYDENVQSEKKEFVDVWKKKYTVVKTNNATEMHKEYLSHCDEDDLKYLSVQNILPWKRGNVLWWNEKQLHSSNNFIANNILSKKFLIIHTYVEE